MVSCGGLLVWFAGELSGLKTLIFSVANHLIEIQTISHIQGLLCGVWAVEVFWFGFEAT